MAIRQYLDNNHIVGVLRRKVTKTEVGWLHWQHSGWEDTHSLPPHGENTHTHPRIFRFNDSQEGRGIWLRRAPRKNTGLLGDFSQMGIGEPIFFGPGLLSADLEISSAIHHQCWILDVSQHRLSLTTCQRVKDFLFAYWVGFETCAVWWQSLTRWYTGTPSNWLPLLRGSEWLMCRGKWRQISVESDN